MELDPDCCSPQPLLPKMLPTTRLLSSNQSLLLVFRLPCLIRLQGDLPATVLIWKLEETWCFVLEMAERVTFHMEKLYVINERH